MSRRSVTIGTLSTLVAWATLGRAEETPAGAAARTGAATGLVVDLQGRPVVGAEVRGMSYQETYAPTRSGNDGRFRLAGLKPGKPVTVWADAPGLARERREDVHIFPGQDRDIGRLALLPGTRIRGRAVDARGKPVGGTGVKLELYRFQLGHTITAQGTAWTFRADGDGRFATPPLPAGRAQFLLGASGKVHTFVWKNAEPGTPVLDIGDISLPDEMPVAGVVVDGEDQPAPGVEIIPDYDRDNAATSGKDGRFVVHGVGKELKQLRLESNDYFSLEPFDVKPGQTGLKLAVIRAYEIHGTAVDAETGRPVPIKTVQLCTVHRDPDDGRVTLAG
jgi:Carboxypeptidase regulatory-like domain